MNTFNKYFRLFPALFIILTCIISCNKGKNDPYTHIHLKHENWSEDAKLAVNDLVDQYGFTKNAYAVFDFDNTCSIFDIEEQLEIFQLETMSFAMNPGELKKAISSGVDPTAGNVSSWIGDIVDAYTYLYNKYGPFTAKGLPESSQALIRQDNMWFEFATKMLNMYDVVADVAGTDASYNWVLYWFSGMTENEVYDLAFESHRKYSSLPTSEVTWKGPESISSRLGAKDYTWTCGIQVTDNIRELWKVLHDNGIDVWVCSASGIQQVLAAIDAFGLHSYCTGVMAMTISLEDGRYISEYDYSNGYAYYADSEGWTHGTVSTGCQTAGKGKVTAIQNVLSSEYGGKGPIVGFMDSTGDFNFCTEFRDTRLVICFNRANRKVTDGGGLIAEVAMYQKNILGYNLRNANESGDILYILQGRDENGMRTLRPSNYTLRYGTSEERLFANEDNQTQLDYFRTHQMSVKDILNHFSIRTTTSESELGFKYGWLDTYDGYRTK